MSFEKFSLWFDQKITFCREHKNYAKIKSFFSYFGFFMALGVVGVLIDSLIAGVVTLLLFVVLFVIFIAQACTRNANLILVLYCLIMFLAGEIVLATIFALLYAYLSVFFLDLSQDKQGT